MTQNLRSLDCDEDYYSIKAPAGLITYEKLMDRRPNVEFNNARQVLCNVVTWGKSIIELNILVVETCLSCHTLI